MKVFKTVLFVLAWLGQLAAEFWAGMHLWQTNMIPVRLFLLGIIALTLIWVLEGVLFFSGMRAQKGKHPGRFRRVVAWILVVLMILGCLASAIATRKLRHTIDAVTSTQNPVSTYAVYVLKEDEAQTLDDAVDYDFGVTMSYDAENTRAAVKQLRTYYNGTLKSENFETILDMVDALYHKDVGAILLCKEYVPLMEDLDEYESYSDDTRILCEFTVEQDLSTSQNLPASTDPESDQTDPFSLSNLEPVKDITQDPFVIYLSGSDTRSALLTRSNSDVNILVIVNPKTKQILLLNTPRDYYIPNPAGNGALDKLTHCGVYGTGCSVQALSDLYHVPINYYAQINFAGFEKLIDAIGGVTVESDYAFTTRHGHFSIQKGTNYLNGEQALGFVRERYSFGSGDNQRGRNQMKLLTAVIKKLSASTLIMHYGQILDSLQGMFVTNVSSDQISELVKMQLSDGAEWNVKSYAVTGAGGSEITYSIPRMRVYVMFQDKDLVDRGINLVDRVINGEILTDADVAKQS